MRNASDDLSRLGGLARRSQMRELGHSDRSLRRLVVTGAAYPLRRNWLATPGALPEAVRAVQLGGVLGGESALRSWGVWVSTHSGLCVAAPPTASRLPPLAPNEYRLHERGFQWPQGWRSSVSDALNTHVRRVPLQHAVASVDSALFQRRLSRSELAGLIARLPRRLGSMAKLVDARCESGLESILRVAAMLEGWNVEVQVYIRGVGRVDLLINGWLVIEADGDAYHSSPQQRAKDRLRDAALVRQGMRCHRFGHTQILNDLPGCMAVIREYLLTR